MHLCSTVSYSLLSAALTCRLGAVMGLRPTSGSLGADMLQQGHGARDLQSNFGPALKRLQTSDENHF